MADDSSAGVRRNTPDLPDRIVRGGAAGLLATMVLYPMRLASQRWLPSTMPPMREDPGEFMVDQAESLLPQEAASRVPDLVETTAAKTLAMGYGATAGAIYGALRSPGHSSVADGLLLGIGTWAAGYLGWLPALDLMPPIGEQQTTEAIGPILRHAVFGVLAVGAYNWLQDWTD